MSEGRAVRFVVPLPGLPGHVEYALDGLEATGTLFSLRSADDSVSLLLAAPWAFFPDYAPVLSDEDVDLLGLAGAEDALLFVVLTTAESAAASTANLLAPVVLNQRTGAAMQVLLTGSDLPVRAPLAA
ncbi:flagellar assembly protein FliW [Aquipuribacter sp. SD81]|uniref:flagellar assembly protein FliW n=1 Tax=Aquipuribacter sp. SD81 TaxID=3127703 RepID=UPI00301AF89D